jgi:membrane fusion protein (multidrug efflux system)
MNIFSRTAILPITFLVISTIGEGCSETEAKTEKSVAAAPAPVTMEGFLLAKDSLTTSIRIPGELIAHQQVDLYAKVNSFVKKLYVDVGSEVRAGQVLAVLEAPELSSQLAGAESRLKAQEAVYLASKASYDRLLQTSKTPGTVSPNDLDQADARQKADLAQLEAAKASYREITDTRNYLEIRAPFSGMITSRNVSNGAYVGPSGKGSELPIFTLQEQKKLRLVVSVPEAYISYLNNKSEVNFTVRSFGGEKFGARVSRFAGALDSRLRSQRTEMDVPNEKKKLLPGMIAEVLLPLNSATRSFVVPSSAVLSSTEGTFVIKVQDQKTVWVPVTTGRRENGKTEIFGELQEKDTLIKSATEEIRNNGNAGNIKI